MSIELKELKPMIQQWGIEKGITNHDKQMLKLFEELGETAGAILRGNKDGIVDGIGDIYVVAAILETIDEVTDGGSLAFQFAQIIRKCALGIPTEAISALEKVCELQKQDLTECANFAWNEIKDRKGKNVNGSFVKESDL